MISTTERGNHPPTSRRGLASVAIMIGLVVIGIIGLGLLKIAVGRRGEVNLQERRLQAEWLARAGLDRASARLAAEDYRGETWKIAPEDLGDRGPGLVVIRVDPVADRARVRRVRVQADYPADSTLRARSSKDRLIELPSPPR